MIGKYHKTDPNQYSNLFGCQKFKDLISKYIWLHHIYQNNIQIHSNAGNDTNTNTNNIQGQFIFIFEYSYKPLFLIT